MKVVGIGKPISNTQKGYKMLHVYLEDPSTPVAAGSAYVDITVFYSESNPRPFETAQSLEIGDDVLPYRNSNGYLEDFVMIGGR